MCHYQLLLVFTIFTIGLSAPVINEPERCCIPKQFSSKVSSTTGMVLPDGSAYKSYARYNFSYDGDREMIGLKGIAYDIPDQKQTKLWIIESQKDGLIYTIDMDTKHCEKTKNPVRTFNCIPDSAVYIDSSNYGYGDKQIIGDTWLVRINDTINYSTVSRGDCIPLTGDMFIGQPQILNTLTTTDYVPRIVDPSVFDIPAECQ